MGFGIEVVTSELRKEARTWGEQSAAIGQVGVRADGLRLTYVTAGVFAPIVQPYEGAVDQISQRCAEGCERMADIESALCLNADAYDRQDEGVAAHIASAY